VLLLKKCRVERHLCPSPRPCDRPCCPTYEQLRTHRTWSMDTPQCEKVTKSGIKLCYALKRIAYAGSNFWKILSTYRMPKNRKRRVSSRQSRYKTMSTATFISLTYDLPSHNTTSRNSFDINYVAGTDRH